MKKLEFFYIVTAAVFIALTFVNKADKTYHLDIQYIHLDSINKIIEINDSLVIPVLYDSLLINDFDPIDVRKQQFINQVLPAILIVRFQLENKGRKVEKIIQKIERGEILTPREEQFANSLMSQFRAKSYDNLLVRLKTHPTSLVLAQAVTESGWGRSRFALEGNNLFGIWSTSTDKNSIKSLYCRDDKSVYLKRYNNLAESIDHYFLTLGRHNAYKRFRLKRNDEVDVFELIETLSKYSESGDEYTLLLKKVILWNDLQKYDNYKIDPKYIIEENNFVKIFNFDKLWK